ncbi:MAG: aldo/keto reductase, partial [Spirochaetales bacterium]|nr:aldo/keto reductase [Candidatus Physcosoma equi]
FHKAVDTGIYAWLQEKKKEGVIRNFGFSFHGYATDLETILSEGSFDFVQLQLNYLDWELQNAKLSYETVTRHGLPVMVMEPVRGGALTTLPEEAEKAMKEMHPDATLASWAFRWVGSLENVLVVLSGMNTIEMLEDNLNTFSGLQCITKEEEEVLDRTRKLVLASRTIPCTKCQYCMPCTVGIQIPNTFALYNKFLLDGDKKAFQDGYKTLEHKGSECVSCKKCMKACPQGINIAEHMKQLDRTVMSLS